MNLSRRKADKFNYRFYYFFCSKFEKIVKEQVQKGFDGRTTDAEHDWNYFGAVLYAVTLVSTIGKLKTKRCLQKNFIDLDLLRLWSHNNKDNSW